MECEQIELYNLRGGFSALAGILGIPKRRGLLGGLAEIMAALQNEIRYDTEYIEALPEGKRAELVDGVLYDMSAPSTGHQRISLNLGADIIFHIREQGGNCQVFTAPFAVYLNSDEYTYVEPDVAVICDPNKVDERGCHGAPDWIVEIVSPSSRRMDYMIKLFKYHDAGVREYWIVDPEKRVVHVYNFESDEMEEYEFGAPVPAGIWPGTLFRIVE